eukprot:gene13665-19552_t
MAPASLPPAVLLLLLAATVPLTYALKPIRVIWSGDVATGLVNGTAGTNVVADPDDGAAVIAGLNQGLAIKILAPVSGNAHVTSEYPVSKYIVHTLKGRTDVDIVAGAAYAIVPFLDPPSAFNDGSQLPLDILVESCINTAVRHMKRLLSKHRHTILATGPMTDVASLVANYPKEAKKIDRVVFLGGRHGNSSLVFNEKEGLTDFNPRMDPVAMQLMLDSNIPLTLIPFNLSSSVSYPPAQFGQNLTAEQKATPAFQYFKVALQARADFYERIGFGSVVIPWDAWTLLHVLHPEALSCKPMLAKMQDCSYAPWDAKYNASNGLQFNDGGPEQQCGGHGAHVTGGSLLLETAQLQVYPLMVGSPMHTVTVCDDVSDPTAPRVSPEGSVLLESTSADFTVSLEGPVLLHSTCIYSTPTFAAGPVAHHPPRKACH